MAFNPEVFRWARETAGLDLEAAAHAVGVVAASLDAIERGDRTPSRTNLLNMAKAYRRSLLSLYAPAPPRRGDRGQDFRTVVADRSVEAEAGLDALVRDIMARQGLVRAVLQDDEDFRPLEFVGSFRSGAAVSELAEAIESLLGVTRVQYRAKRTADDAFNLLREQAERAGIFVILAGNLGSHHSAIPVEAFRGFAIADNIAPFIVINDGDARAAWSFTLLHEVAHLFLGASGVSAGAPDMDIERFCNDVAAAFLLPHPDLQTIKVEGLSVAEVITAISDGSNRWHVSRQMVAYGLYKAGRISLESWKQLEKGIRERWAAERREVKERAKERKAAVSYYVVRRHRLGKAMLDFARRYTEAGDLSATKAAKVLGVKPRSVYPLLAA
jgi:Zn-dependent peptidase ImmA (M78 family)/DNA-binding XRE family transcriptional regulator